MKTCTKCCEHKSRDRFFRRANARDGLYGWCKDCFCEYQKENRKRPESREKYRRYRREYERKRRANDPLYAEAGRMMARVRDAFRHAGKKKIKRTEQMLGCTWGQFQEHIESQFQPGMTWSNRSEWHIDHTIPLSHAETVDDLERLAHYTNCKPMWAAENMAKGARWIG